MGDKREELAVDDRRLGRTETVRRRRMRALLVCFYDESVPRQPDELKVTPGDRQALVGAQLLHRSTPPYHYTLLAAGRSLAERHIAQRGHRT